MKIHDATVLITGANRGLGLAFAREALARGARKVYGGVRDPSKFTLPGVEAVRLVQGPAQVAEFWCMAQPQVEHEREVGHLDWKSERPATGHRPARSGSNPSVARSSRHARWQKTDSRWLHDRGDNYLDARRSGLPRSRLQ